MSQGNHEEDDESTPPVRLVHPANRALLAVVCDLLVDSVEHQRALKQVADAIRDSTTEVGVSLIHNLAVEIRRDGAKRLSRADELDVLMKAGE